jgi:hypothetical protein
MMAHSRTHDVFISYRSSRSPDREIAERLQRTLETYPVPSTLRHSLVKPARYAFQPSRLRVFRDGSDLSAAPNLWQAIREQLLRSRWLIVVCSPATPQSSWISKEIDTFVEAHGREHVIAVLIEGQPEDSIPTQLQSVAPRAADLRASDVRSAVALLNGWRTPKTRQKRFDVLAPLLGLSSRDDLVQRHRARGRRRAGAAALVAFLVAVGAGYLANRTEVAEALAREADLRREIAEVLAREEGARREVAEARATAAEATSDVAIRDKELAQAHAVANAMREEVEREKRIRETAMRQLSEAYRHRFADPFSAAAAAYESIQSRTLEDSGPAMDVIHDVLVQRRASSIHESAIVRHSLFTFSSQSSEGEKYTSLSRDGNRVLVITERKGDRFSPELPGDAYVLDNRTLQLVRLNSCETHPYRLEYAAFLGDDKVVVARAFYVDIYSVSGQCLGRFHLLKTKTPVTAAGGMLRDALFVAGNGAGCVWFEEEGKRGLEPSKELGVVQFCDDKNEPDAVMQVLADPSGDRGLLVFQSGRIDLFGFDRPNGHPKRRPVVRKGGHAAAFQGGAGRSYFAVSRSASIGSQRLELWDASGPKPKRVRSFSLEGIDAPIDYLGFPSNGRMLIGVDARCALHYWNTESGTHLLTRPSGNRECLAAESPDEPRDTPLVAASSL